MEFIDFCRVNGLILDHVKPGRWVRTPTTDHPHKRNGAYKLMGDIGWVQNHATMVQPETWRHEGPQTDGQRRAVVQQAEEFDRRMRAGWARAEGRSQSLIDSCKVKPHNYLTLKGFADGQGLVADSYTRTKHIEEQFVEQTDRDVLVVPMRHLHTNALQGAQAIYWAAESLTWKKEMVAGMRAKGAVLRLGSKRTPRTWLVEGFATGLSVQAALRLRRLPDAVLVCFSDGNLMHVAKQLEGDVAVFADNDASGAGERAAKATGMPYCMAPTVGWDANDMHIKAGLFRVAALMSSVPHRVSEAVP